MGTLWNDLRYGARMLWQNPGFTLVAVMALALGIGATSAIYTVVDAALLQPLPFPEPDRLMVIRTLLRGQPAPASFPDLVDYRERSHVFSDVAGFDHDSVILTGGSDPQHLHAVVSTPNLFRTLGVAPALGRSFADDDARAGSRVVILAHNFWQSRFGGDRDIIGKTVQLDGDNYTIVGVTAPGFAYPIGNEGWTPSVYLPFPRNAMDQQIAAVRGAHEFRTTARLKPGVTLAQAQADLEAVAAAMRHDHPGDEEDGHLGLGVLSLHELTTKPARTPLLLLLCAVACVLAIACANVAGLLLARATVRQREIAIRAALGASRGRIVRQMLTESALLGVLGGGAGVLLALWLVDLLVALVSSGLPKIHAVEINTRVLGVTFGLSVATGLAFGLWPALHASRADLTGALTQTARATAHARSRRARNALLVGEMALALMLLTGAALMMRSFMALHAVDLGFKPHGLVVAQMDLPSTRYGKDAEVEEYYAALSRRVAGLPGTGAVAIGAPAPFANADMQIGLWPTGGKQSPKVPTARFVAVSPGYFATLGIPLLQGRDFSSADDQYKAAATMLVSKTFAERMYGGQDAIGKHITIGLGLDDNPNPDTGLDCEIIGVVGDVHHHDLDEPLIPAIYTAYGRTPIGRVGVVARTDAPAAVMPTLRRAILDADQNLPPPLLATMDSLVDASTGGPRALMILLGIFAFVALVLASIGIYGVISYTVTQRTREIGIRVALGASGRQVMRLVLGESLRLALVAMAIGLAAALAMGRLARGLVYGVAPDDPLTLAAVCATVLAVSLAAGFLPARRATKVDPMVALRYE